MKNVAAILILMLLLVAGGSYAATTLKTESMPDVSFPFVAVTTSYQASPKDVLEQVTKPIEQAIAGLDGIKVMVSTSAENSSQVLVQLNAGAEPETFKKDAEAAMANVRLPQNAGRPIVATEGFSSSPVYYLSILATNEMSQEKLDERYQDTLLPGFLALEGIDHLDSIGSREASVSVKLKGEALNRYGLTPVQVAGLIRASIASSPVGAVDVQQNTQMVRVRGDLDTLAKLESLKLPTTKGIVSLKELGTVQSIYESKFLTRYDGKPAIGVHLYKTKAANEVEFAAGVDKLIESWKQSNPDITVQTVFNGASDIKKSIEGMLREGIMGAILASLMILLFLRNLRMTLIVLVSIPLSILASLLLMSALDISLNIMTLGGMAISVGRVVDDSIVVIENIYTHLQKAQRRNESVIRFATKQVSSAITSSTLTTVGVFAPIAFVSGIVGEVFVPFALTLVCALLASLIVALTVIPVLAKIMVLRDTGDAKPHKETVGRTVGGYKKVLVWSLNHWIITLVAAAILLGSAIVFITPKLPVAFMPESESDRSMFFTLIMPRGTTIDKTDQETKKVEDLLRNAKDANNNPQFKFVESMVGYNWGTEQVASRTLFMTEVNESSKAKDVLKQYKDSIQAMLPTGARIAGEIVTFGPSNEASSSMSYSLKSDSLDKLKQASALVQEKMKQFPELVDVKDNLTDAKKEIDITVNPEKASLVGLTNAQVIEQVNGWIGKQQLGSLPLNGLNYKTTVELDGTEKGSLEHIAKLPLRSLAGGEIKLSDIATVTSIDAPNTINREMQEQVVRISARIEGADKQGISNKVTEALKSVDLPPGVSREVKGVSDEVDKSFREMFIAMGVSVLIVYLVMVIAFGNASAPFAILFSLPLAAIGGLLGLLIARETVNVTSLIGFLMLIGIVVTNAIVLIDRVQQLRGEGRSVREALVEAGMSRLRPIVMTAGATIMTLLPLALGFSKGAFISKGLAVVVIGGLTTSTLLTLVIVPIIYERNEAIKTQFRKWFKSRKQAVEKSAA